MNTPEIRNGQNQQDLPSLKMSPFEAIRRTDENGADFWSSRDLARVLDYADYDKFKAVIEKAKLNCSNTNQPADDHFRHAAEMITIGKGGQREIEAIYVSRYGSYMIILNADPSKPTVALGKAYFAVQTRRQELSDAHAAEAKSHHEIPYPESILFNGKIASGGKQRMTKAARSYLTKKYFSFWEEINSEPEQRLQNEREAAQAENLLLIRENNALQKKYIAVLEQKISNLTAATAPKAADKSDSRFDWKPFTGENGAN